MGMFSLAVLLGLLGLMAFVRFSPADPGRWHVSPPDAAGPPDAVQAQTGGATLHLSPTFGTPAEVLARLDAIALATPRTRRLAGSVAEGRITWETRSALWGFPDYTTAEARGDGVHIAARLRFGQSDLGVNAARLRGWLQALAG